MSPETRIGDAERDAAVTALGEHYAAGRLTKEEYDERAEQAWAARTASGLTPLFVDLPQPHGWVPAPSQSAVAPTGRARRGFRPPLLPVVAILIGVALLVGHPWVFFLLIGWFWWSGHAVRQARRRRAWEQMRHDGPAWVQGWQHGHGRRGW
ncbi:MAG: DUF1707 SHOCT-like domain-containing protein [Nocardioides sp.]